MADALRPLVSGLGDFTIASGVYPCFVDGGNSEDAELTHEGVHQIDEMASVAAGGGRSLDHAVGSRLHRYLPDWCESQLYEVNLLVERIAWILYGAAAAVDDGSSPERPSWAAVHGYDMARDAYRELCAKYDDYTAAQKVAIDKQYEVHGLHQAAERGVAPHAGDAQGDGGFVMTAPEKETAERIRLPIGIPGVGRAGDCVVYDPNHADPRFRLSNVHPLDLDRLGEIRETVREWADAANRKEVVGCRRTDPEA